MKLRGIKRLLAGVLAITLAVTPSPVMLYADDDIVVSEPSQESNSEVVIAEIDCETDYGIVVPAATSEGDLVVAPVEQVLGDEVHTVEEAIIEAITVENVPTIENATIDASTTEDSSNEDLGDLEENVESIVQQAQESVAAIADDADGSVSAPVSEELPSVDDISMLLPQGVESEEAKEATIIDVNSANNTESSDDSQVEDNNEAADVATEISTDANLAIGSNNGGAGSDSSTPDKPLDIEITILERIINHGKGIDNNIEIVYRIGADKVYSCYIYGDGVTVEDCEQLIYNAVNGINGSPVINQALVDADKNSYKDNYVSSAVGDELPEDFNYIGYDSELCWALTASNSLYQTGWSKYLDAGIFNKNGSASWLFESEDDFADYARYCFNDMPYYISTYYDWIFTGSNESMMNEIGKFGYDKNDALLSKYNASYSNVYASEGTANFSDMTNKLEKLLISIKDDNKDYSTAYMPGLTVSFSSGAHCITQTGYIAEVDFDSKNNVTTVKKPISVIIADSDNSMKTDNPTSYTYGRDKVNSYTSYNLTQKENGLYYMDGYGAVIVQSTPLSVANGTPMLAENPIVYPTVVRAVDKAVTGQATVEETLTLSLNTDFMDFYDINRLKYKVVDDAGNVIENYIDKDAYSANSLLNFDLHSISEEIKSDSFSIVVGIDSTCFHGNYGWFALKTDYSDELMNVMVRVTKEAEPNNPGAQPTYKIEEVTETVPDSYWDYISAWMEENGIVSKYPWTNSTSTVASDSSQKAAGSSADSENDGFYTNDFVFADNGVQDTFRYGSYSNAGYNIVAQDTDTGFIVDGFTQHELQVAAMSIANDIAYAQSGDNYMDDLFENVDVDADSLDISDVEVVYATDVKVTKTDKFTLKDPKHIYKKTDKVFAKVMLANGTYKFVRVTVNNDGSLSFILTHDVIGFAIYKI